MQLMRRGELITNTGLRFFFLIKTNFFRSFKFYIIRPIHFSYTGVSFLLLFSFRKSIEYEFVFFFLDGRQFFIGYYYSVITAQRKQFNAIPNN